MTVGREAGAFSGVLASCEDSPPVVCGPSRLVRAREAAALMQT